MRRLFAPAGLGAAAAIAACLCATAQGRQAAAAEHTGATGHARLNTHAPLNVCAAIPLATVVSLTGRRYTQTKSAQATIGGHVVTKCTYNNGKTDPDHILDLEQLGITVLRDVNARNGLILFDADSGGDLNPVSGIGDIAQGDENELDVGWGQDVAGIADEVQPPGEPDLPQSVFRALAQKVHQALSAKPRKHR